MLSLVNTLSTRSELSFAWEKIDHLLAEGLAEITEKHWKEIALDQADVPLDVDWRALRASEITGNYKVFVARRDDRLIGYLPFLFWYPQRYSSTLFIQDDTVFVIPEEPNRARIWFEMLDRAMSDLPRGAKFQMRVRPQHGGHRIGKILEKRYGMVLSEMTYTMVLK